MVRVHELARELDRTSNELLAELQKMGSEAVKAINTITAEEERILREKFGGGQAADSPARGKPQIGKRVTLSDESQEYEPVRLKSREAEVKRDFRGSEQASSSTLAPKPAKKGPTRERETTTTKIIKKTIVRKRYVRMQGQTPVTATPAVEPRPHTPVEVPVQLPKDRQPKKRSRLTIEGAVLPTAVEEHVEAPPAPPEVPVQVPVKAKPIDVKHKAGKAPTGAAATTTPTARDLRDKRRRRRPPKPKETVEVDLQRSLEQLKEKGIKSDLTTAGRKPLAGKKTKKKRKKILATEKDRRFEKGERRLKVKGRERERGVESTGLVKRRSRRRFEGRVALPPKPPMPQRRVKVTPSMTIKDLSEATGIKAGEIIKFLVSDLGVFATINQVVDLDIIKLVLENFDFEYDVRIREVEDEIEHEPDVEEDLEKRPPVVVVLGHVDHGKTRLLDTVRHANVIDTEAGAITQHIGAYQAQVDGRKITFLDTPGHEAFTAMRARGAQVTDIAILVVACDDGVMPQTVEAINHARSAGLEIIVALNKVDKDNADAERIKSQLVEYGLVPEDWGGKTIMVPISAKFGQGIDDLLEMVLLTADILNLKGNPKVKTEGTVLEARLDKGLGVVATALVQRGILKPGEIVVCGVSWGRIRQMTDENGLPMKECGPGTPCQITGLSDVPAAGDKIYQVKDEKVAKDIYSQRQINRRQERIHAVNRISLEDFYEQLGRGMVKDLNIILKADVQGSIEAIVGALEKLSTNDIKVKFIHSAVGNINENDVMLAMASDAIVIGFTVDISPEARRQAQLEGVDVRIYDVIYKVVEDIELAIQGMLEPEYEDRVIGRAEVKAIFRKTKNSVIAGLLVESGKMVKGMNIRIYRDSQVVFEGQLSNLKRFQEDVREIDEGLECGIMLDGYNDLQEGDIIEGHEVVEVGKV